MDEGVELDLVGFSEFSEVHDCNGGSVVNLAHARSGDVALHAVLPRELAEFDPLELRADGDTLALADGIDEVLVVRFIAVIRQENDLSLFVLDGLDGLSVSRH